MVRQAIRKRKHRPIYIVDIAVPRDVDPAVAKLDDVYLYTVDDLQGVIDENMKNREQAAKQAEEIIDTQVSQFMDWMSTLDTVSTIRAIRDNAEAMQQEVLDAALKRLRTGEEPEAVLRELARSLSNKLIHAPSVQLRSSSPEQKDELVRAARTLFAITPSSGTPDTDK
jgi:glutamyl-tRNA reductase